LVLLERHLAGAGPPLLVLAGEPGMGKTRLLQQAAHHAEAQGWTVLVGGCQRRDGQAPFAPLLQALAQRLRRQPVAQQRTDLQGCAWLVRLLPELAGGPIEPLPSWQISPEQERRLLHDAVGRFLSNVAGACGTLLVLDDLQWASADALDLLAALVWSAPDRPMRVVCAYRDTEVPPDTPLAALLADLAHATLATHRTLRPLSASEMDALLAHLLRQGGIDHVALGEHVPRRFEGVPFYLVSYVQELGTGTVGSESGVPWSLAQSVRQRVAALPGAGQETVRAAAVLGRVVARPVLQAMLSRPDGEVVAALEAVCRARLLEEEGREAYRFPHDVIREAVYADLSAVRRVRLHQRAVEALEAQPAGGGLEALAYHAEQGEVWARALTYLVEAGDLARAACAVQAALDYYGRAQAVSTRLSDAGLPVALDVTRKRGLLLIDSGHAGAAVAAFTQMGELAQRLGDQHLYGLALCHLGRAALQAHRSEEAEAALRAALVVAEAGYEDVAIAAHIWLISSHILHNRLVDAAALIQAALALAARVEDAASCMGLAGFAAGIHNWAGRFDEAMAVIERWRVAPVDSPGSHSLLSSGWQEGMIRGGRGEYRQALAVLQSTLGMGERLGDYGARGPCLNTLGWIHGELQDHERAIELNRQSLQAALRSKDPDPEAEHNARLNLGDSLLALGRLEEAEQQFQIVERVVRQPQPTELYMLWRYSQHLFHSYGELCLVCGDLARAFAYTNECLTLAQATDSKKNVIKARRLRSQVLLAQGSLGETATEIASALALARQVGNPPQLWKTLAAFGDLLQAQGRGDEAGRAYQEALQVITSVAAALDDPVLSSTFLTSQQVERIRKLADHRG
jgi:tetratricopeptide (TPR) repeat protein